MQKLNPKVVWLFFIRFLFAGLFPIVILFFYLLGILLDTKVIGMKLGYLWWIVLAFILFIAFCWIWAKLTYRFWAYQLSENAFKKEHGVIWKKYVSIPYERIQNVDIHRGLFARILGLSDLKIQTAGSSAVSYGRGRMYGIGAEGYLPGLSVEVAEQLRDELIERSKGTKQGL